MADFETYTCVRWVPRPVSANFPNYVAFRTDTAFPFTAFPLPSQVSLVKRSQPMSRNRCTSHLGMIGGRQEVETWIRHWQTKQLPLSN